MRLFGGLRPPFDADTEAPSLARGLGGVFEGGSGILAAANVAETLTR